MIATRKEIEEAMSELRLSLLEAIELDDTLMSLELKKKKNHKRVSLAHDTVRALRYN